MTETVITNSDLNTFQVCPRQWYYRSYRRLKPNLAPLTGALPFGSRIHKALEADEKGELPMQVAWQALVEHDRNVMLASGLSTEDLDKEDDLGKIMLDGYAEWETEEGFYSEYEVVGVETPLSSLLHVPEIDAEILVRGKLDRLLRRIADGSLWVGDYKTMGTFSERDLSNLARSPQPRLYAMLVRQQRDRSEWVAGTIYTLLRKVKRTARANPPFYQHVKIALSDHDLEQYRLRMVGMAQRLLDAARRLDAGEDHRIVTPFHPTWQCQTCPFKTACFLANDTGLEASEAYLADNFHEGDPWDRYETTDDGVA